MQSRSEIRDELEQRIANGQLVSCPVREEPLPIVVGAQVAKESKQRWSEISPSAHSNLEAGRSSVGGKETPIPRIARAAIDSFIDIVNHREITVVSLSGQRGSSLLSL
jgi:hypothetical protein